MDCRGEGVPQEGFAVRRIPLNALAILGLSNPGSHSPPVAAGSTVRFYAALFTRRLSSVAMPTRPIRSSVREGSAWRACGGELG